MYGLIEIVVIGSRLYIVIKEKGSSLRLTFNV